MVYLYLLLFTAFFPLFLSFDRNVRFYRKWKYFFPAVIIPAAAFIFWDYYFTQKGIWGFNENYVMGAYLFGLPLEEIAFFLVIPFACVFVYECLNFYVKKDYLQSFAPYISAFVSLALTGIAIFHLDKLYTSTTFLLTAALIIIVQWIIKAKYIGRFYFSFLLIIFPFFLINGILTYLPVVWYNDAYNLGIRIITIPVEDVFYGFSLLLATVIIYEKLQKKKEVCCQN